MHTKTRMALIVLAGAMLLGPATAFAGTLRWDFNGDNSSLSFGGSLWDGVTLDHTGSANVIHSGGAGPLGSTANGPVAGVEHDGFLQLTKGSGHYDIGGVLFGDWEEGLVVAAFTLECDVRIGNGSAIPGEGFSINYVRSNDPVALPLWMGDTFMEMNNAISPNGGQFSDNGSATNVSLVEEGTMTGLSIGFDARAGGDYTMPPIPPAVGRVAPGLTHDDPGLDVRVDGLLVATVKMPALNGAADDALSLQTGPYDGTGANANLKWVHLKVDLSTDGVLNVWYKKTLVLSNLQTAYYPSVGRLLLAARTSDATQNQEVDNIQLTTVPAPTIGPSLDSTPIGFSIWTWAPVGNVLDTNMIQLQLNGTPVTPMSVTKFGGSIFITYKDPTKPSPPGATNTVTLTVKDTWGNTIRREHLTYLVQSYLTLPADYALTDVDTNKPGFLIRTYQVAAPLDDELNVAEAVLHGDAGTNIANLSAFAGGAYTETDVINYSRRLDTGLIEAAGDYREVFDTDGNPLPWSQPDAQIPGLPSLSRPNPNGTVNNNNAAMEILTYLQFPKAGLYELIFNTGDSFRTQFGKGDAARDQLNSLIVSQYDGEHPMADSMVLLYVPAAGFYAARTVWLHVTGVASLEWSAVNDDGLIGADGTRALINDSAVAGSLKAYRARTDAPRPLITSVSKNAAGTITVEWTGDSVLQTAPTVRGPWVNLPEATSPHTFTPETTMLFSRIRQ